MTTHFPSPASDPPAVVVVTHFGGAPLARCIAALDCQTQAPSRVLIVVSTDAEVVVPAGFGTLQLSAPTDFAAAANAGLRAVGAVPVVLLNDDTVPTPTFIERLSAAVDGPGIYQPHILLAAGNGRIDNTGHTLFADGFNLARGRGQIGETYADEAGAFSGAAVLFTPDVLATVGLFDEDFGAFGEDLDLSLRARRAGFRIRYVSDAIIHHELGASYGRVNPRKIFLVERNRTRAAVRSLPLTALAALPTSTALRLSMQAAGAAMGRGLGVGAGPLGLLAVLAGNTAGWACAPSAWAKRRRDRPHWRLDEREMLGHMARHRARAADLIGPHGGALRATDGSAR